MVTNRIFVAASLFSFALFPFAARADVHVSTWVELKDAVENGDGGTIYLDNNITADLNAPITTYVAGTVIDGQGFKLVGPEQTGDTKVNANFFNFSTNFSKDFTEEQRLKIQNLNFENGSASYGGAIYNSGGMTGDITGSFSGNYLDDNGFSRPSFCGGAIYNSGTMGDIKGNFSDNHISAAGSYGGAIYNSGTIGNINGNFLNNYAKITYAVGHGGAIDNNGVIGDIKANFSGNYVESNLVYLDRAYGGAIENYGYAHMIGDIIGNFSGNYVSGKISAYGGAISNWENSSIGNITGNFSGNYAKSVTGEAYGGAIYNSYDARISNILNSSFYNNYAQTGSTDINNVAGGAIYNSYLDLFITADNGKSEFSGNKIIYKDDKGNDIEKSEAIYLGEETNLKLNSINNGLIKFDDGIRAYNEQEEIPEDDFLAMLQEAEAMGLNIEQNGNKYAITGNVDGVDIIYIAEPTASNTYLVKIYAGGTIIITGDASSRVEFNEQIEGVGSIDVSGTNVDVNKGVFYRSITHDGGVLNINSAAEDTVVDNLGLVNIASGASAKRNAVNDGGKMIVHAGGLAEDTTVNSGGSLSVEAAGRLHNMLANSGAILDMESGAVLSGNITIHAGAQMGGSYDYSKIFEDDDKDDGSLTLIGGLNDAMQENSLITSTEAKKLNLADGFFALGDGTQSVRGWDSLNVKDNATLKVEGHMALADASKNINLLNGSTMDLAGHSPSNYTIIGSLNNDGHVTFSHEDDEADDITTIYGNYKAFANAELTIDVNPAANLADKLVIEGDVEGSTKVVLNALTEDKPSSKVVFVEAPNDNIDTGAYFDIYRVMGNPYKWNSLYEDNKWYVGTDDLIADGSESGYGDKEDKGDLADETQGDAVLPPNFPAVPDLDADKKQDANKGTKPSVVAEVIAYGGLANAGIEQTRTLFANVRNNISGDKVYNTVCGGSYACGYDNEALKRVWASPVYSTSKVKAPYKYDADITGLDAGFDIQSDVYNRLGVFASYRKGEYDFKGDSDYFVSKTGSEIDIDSYLGGLYYRYDRGMGHVTAMVYGGIEEADIKTDDGVSAKTDGYVYGAAVEVGRGYAITKDTILEPGVAVSYTGLKYDDIHDRYGKSAKYDDVSNLEAELYLRAEKNIKLDNGIGKLYLKPAIVHNMGEGKVAITGLDKVDSLKDMTYGRIEAGGSMELTNGWSLYGNISQAFGSDYHATSFNIGVSYAF